MITSVIGSLRATVALVAVFLCGPVVFSQSEPCLDLDGDGYFAGPGCGVQEDCNDQNANVHPIAVEVCNGWDDDCDGDLDEGCDRLCSQPGVARRVRVDDSAVEIRIATASDGWVVVYDDTAAETPSTSTRLAEDGTRLAPKTVFAMDYPEDHEVVWTGTEMASAWWRNPSDSMTPGLFLRRLGPWGRPIQDEVLLQTAFSIRPHEGILFGGFEYSVFWGEPGIEPGGRQRLSRVGPDGGIRDGEISLGEEYYEAAAYAWNGAGIGCILDMASAETQHDELFFRHYDSFGSPLGPLIRITDHAGQSEIKSVSFDLRLVHLGAGRGYGALWSDYRTGEWQAWFARLDEDGNLMDPPGEVRVSDIDRNISRQTDLVWNGEEFLVVWIDSTGSLSDGTGKVAATRISSDGQVLSKTLLTAGTTSSEPRAAWNGRSYGVVHEQTDVSVNVEFLRMDCRCATDGDLDGVLPCEGGDCDDSDPDVALGEREVCTDGKDNDCDGLTDCNDDDCDQNGKAPLEIAGLTLEPDKTTLTWQEDGNADDYDVARGLLSDLGGMANFLWAECTEKRWAGTSWPDPDVPPAGDGFYYLVRGHARTCVIGPWGTTLREDTLTGCH